jgi:hypothetical protein
VRSTAPTRAGRTGARHGRRTAAPPQVPYPSLKAFPSLADTTPESLDDNRLTRFHPTELIEMGVTAPAVGTPGGTPGVYSNTNYLLLCQLLEQLTGTTAPVAAPSGVMTDPSGALERYR